MAMKPMITLSPHFFLSSSWLHERTICKRHLLEIWVNAIAWEVFCTPWLLWSQILTLTVACFTAINGKVFDFWFIYCITIPKFSYSQCFGEITDIWPGQMIDSRVKPPRINQGSIACCAHVQWCILPTVTNTLQLWVTVTISLLVCALDSTHSVLLQTTQLFHLKTV